MRMFITSRFRLIVSPIAIAASLQVQSAHAEPALDRVLAGVQVANQKQCSALKIGFNLRVRYLSHFPIASGQELRVMLRPIDSAQAAAEIMTRRESLRAPVIKFGHLRAIDFEAGNAAGPVLVLQFAETVKFDVSQGDDFQSIIVKVHGKGKSAECKSPFTGKGTLGQWSTTVVTEQSASAGTGTQIGRAVRAGRTSPGTATDAQKRSAAAMLDEGRGALRKNKLSIAIAKFTAIVKMPETESTPEAQELLGLAKQRNNQQGDARAEYEDYLTRYPTGEGADRVRQRLSGLVTAESDGGPVLKSAKSAAGNRDDGTQTWTVSGSASQFYIRDDSFRTLRDPSLPPTITNDLDAHETHQNQLLSSLDAIATWSGNGVKSKLRFSGTEEHEFGDEGGDIVGVAALFIDTSVRDWGTSARVGRQTRNTGGILGRFDGGVLSYDAAQSVRLNGVVGSPVQRRRDTPFEDEKLFYGGSIDLGPFDGFDMTLFAIEQRDRDIIDRRAIGAEARYVDTDKSAFATIDYDIHFMELNAALLTSSWTFQDKSTIHGAFDYRRSPYFSTWTALQGQVYPTLYEMLKFKTIDEIEELAVDRTASFTSTSVGFSRPINNTFQVSLDATVTNLEGTPASDIVGATDGTGNEYFYSAQVIGNDVMETGDLLIAGVRFADMDRSNYYVMDLSARYPLMENLKINPRLMLGYRTGDTTDLVEYTVLPSVLFNYYVTTDLSLELEVGGRWTDTTENGVEETSTDLFFTIGYRYDFYADGTVLSQSRMAPYGSGAAK